MDYLYSPYQDIWINGHGNDSPNKEFKTSSKTEEEMKKLTIDENLTEIQKVNYIMTKGQNFQKFAIYTSLKRLLKDTEFQQKSLQYILDDVLTQDEENQIEAAKSFKLVISSKFLEKNYQIKLFAVTLSMLKIWSQNVLIAWVDVFQELLTIIPFQTIEKDCINLIFLLSDHSQPISSRFISGKIIGIVAERMKEGFPSNLMEKVRALCQDSDVQIRKMMVNDVIEKICCAIGPEKTEIYLFEKIMELIYDAEINVKSASIKLAFRIIDYYPLEIKNHRIANLFIELLSSINEEVLKVISNMIGQIVFKLDSSLKKNPSYISSILSTFKEYGTNKNEEIRKNFSYNLPAILNVIDFKQFDNYKTIYINHLMQDKCLEVRLIAVSGLHEIMKLIGYEESNRNFKDVFKSLLKECNLSIMKKLLENFNKILEGFFNEEIFNNDEFAENYQEFLQSSINLINKLHKENQWRLQYKLLEELGKELKYFKMNDLNEKYYPILQILLKQGVYEIRRISCLNIVKFLKINYNEKKRIEILKFFNEQMLKSKCYFHRMTYLDFANSCTEYFSRNFLKLNLFPECFKLSSDRVPNVRLKLASIMPNFRKRIAQNDKDNLFYFNEAMQSLKKDLDLEVENNASLSLKSINSIKYDNEEFLKEVDKFDYERIVEEEELKYFEIKENDDLKKKDITDNDLYISTNYYNKAKLKSKTPSSAGFGSYRFSTGKALSSSQTLSGQSGIVSKFKLSKDLTNIMEKPKTHSNNSPNHLNSPVSAKVNFGLSQNLEKIPVINVKKISEEKKTNNNKEINRDIMSASNSKNVKINEKPLKLPEISKEKKSPEKKLEKNDKFFEKKK